MRGAVREAPGSPSTTSAVRCRAVPMQPSLRLMHDRFRSPAAAFSGRSGSAMMACPRARDARHVLVDRHPQPDDEVVRHRRADGLEHLPAEAGAVLQATSVPPCGLSRRFPRWAAWKSRWRPNTRRCSRSAGFTEHHIGSPM